MKRPIVILATVLVCLCGDSLHRQYENRKRSHAATAPRSTSAIASTSATAKTKCCAFAPDDALPAPAAVSSGPEEERAILLAEQVLAGGAGTLPALVAALQQAGFPIRDASGKIVVQPVGKSQGIVFEQWEVNALAEMIANRKQATVPLDNFSQVIASPLPELRDAPMPDLVLDGVRRHARDKDGSMLFWAVFIAELGRQSQVHKPYDILFDIDPANTQLDILQIVLICKRMAADGAVVANPDKVGKKQALHLPHLPAWLEPTVYAAEPPCKFGETPTEIIDWLAASEVFGFDKLAEYLVKQEARGAETGSRILKFGNIILAYAKLAVAMVAFDMKIEMQGRTPLVRTQKQWPATGERKTLVATLRMDTSKLQWVNCVRLALNALGLDFSVEKDGPIGEASVSWSGESGFGGQLVQFAGDPGSRRFQEQGGGMTSPILDARTDESGRATVEVEGVGQHRDLGSDPKPDMKKAKAIAMAVLKPANMYRDFKDATVTALGGLAGLWAMPAEMMYRTNLSFGAWYAFPVKDWTPGYAGWTGFIKDTMVKRQIIEKNVDSKCCGGLPITARQHDMTLEVVMQQWSVDSDSETDAPTPALATSKGSYSVTAGLTSKITFDRSAWNSCNGGPEPTWSKHTIDAVATASLAGKAEVRVSVAADGSYSISADRSDAVLQGERKTTRVLAYGPSCGAIAPSETLKGTGHYSPPLLVPTIHGTVDPDADDYLIGSKVEVEKDSRVGIINTHTYTWSFSRER